MENYESPRKIKANPGEPFKTKTKNTKENQENQQNQENEENIRKTRTVHLSVRKIYNRINKMVYIRY